MSDLTNFSLFEMTPDLVCIAGRDGFFKKINQAVLHKLEYSQTELLARPISDFMHPEDIALTAARREELLSGKALLNFENRYLNKSGKTIWLQWTSIYIPDKDIVFAIAKDITEKKLAEIAVEEKYIRYKSLAAHFKSKIEKDRKYFAVELHEELAQLATAIKLDIESIDANTPGVAAQVKERIQSVSQVSRMLIDTIKKIAFNVSPYILHDLGLHETIKWSCKEFTILNNIPCHFKSAFDEAHLTDEMKMDFFRICQESLINIVRHAAASAVNISITETEDAIQLSVSDDGKGFEPGQQINTPGLTTMKELAASIDGDLTINSEPGKGTIIQLSVLKQNHQSNTASLLIHE